MILSTQSVDKFYFDCFQDYLAKHLALYHCKLDELLLDEDLLKEKRAKFVNKPKRVSIGDCCVICRNTMVSREHVCRHFLPELLSIVNTFDSPLSCGECEFTATKSEYVARHLGLVHLKLDEFLSDSEIVAKKIQVPLFYYSNHLNTRCPKS